ncbi:MAG: hypothetical protein ACO2ZL_01515 [Flavobacteriales bacterium]|jgi:hypothetical protein
MNHTSLATFAFLVVLAFSSCTKYDQDGSLFHLRTPEKRILGNWQSVRVQEVGVEADTNMTELLGSNNLRLSAEFRDDATVTIFNEGEALTYEGTWAFNDDASILNLQVSNMETMGPFYLDSAGNDRTAFQATFASLLMEPDTFIFETGTYVDITETARPLAEQLMTSYTAYTYVGGGAFFDYTFGDDVTGVMDDFIDDLLSEGIITNSEDTDGIIAGMLDEYGVELEFIIVDSAVSGWGDPGLEAAFYAAYGINVSVLIGAVASGPTDPAILSYIEANEGISLSETYTDELKELSIYWKVLELELDDFQAYQFREYDGEDIYDYSYLLRFENQD